MFGSPTSASYRQPNPSGPVFLAATFVVAVCLSIVAIEAWRSITARRIQMEESESSATNLSRSLAQHATDAFKQADAVLLAIVDHLNADGINPGSIARVHGLLVTEVAELPQLQRLSLIDAQGNWMITDLPKFAGGDDHLTREYFQYHNTHADLTPHLGPPIRSRTTNQWIVTISRRFNDANGEFAGIALASIDLDYFNRYYGQFDIGRRGAIVLAMNDGLVMDRRPYKEDNIGTSMAGGPLFTQYVSQRSQGTATVVSTVDGIERINAFIKLQEYPAFVVVAFSTDEILQVWVDDALTHGFGALVLIGVLALIGSRLVMQIRQRVRAEADLLQSQVALQELNARLDALAHQDALTGLDNRRELDRVMDQEVKRAARHDGVVALLMIDVDRFKSYNDAYGHPMGDECLRVIAAAITQGIRRPGDTAARFGGEEFAVLLPGTNDIGAINIADKMRDALRMSAVPHASNAGGIVTVSIGIGVLFAGDIDASAGQLLRHADEALYLAKERGRDRVEVYRPSAT
jgi:diguanylate cyclase (GGDEF)-like protein